MPLEDCEGTKLMTYVITKPCIGVKDAACVDVCPVDCIHPRKDEPGFEAAEMLFIDPGVCIDCGLCVDECPVGAIFQDVDVPQELHQYIEINAAHFRETPRT